MSTRSRAENANLSVYGYIRRNISNVIPTEIIELCIAFYLNQCAFNTEECGNDLIFLDGDTTVKKTKDSTNARWSTCLLGMSINDTMCDVFDIYFKWIQSSSNKSHASFNIGFITSSINESIKDWNQRLGETVNRYSKCIMIGSSYKHLWLYEKSWWKELNTYTVSTSFKQSDEFMLSFDFGKDKYKVYHNGKLAVTLSLQNVREFIPGISIYYKDETIQVTKWNFHKDDKTWS